MPHGWWGAGREPCRLQRAWSARRAGQTAPTHHEARAGPSRPCTTCQPRQPRSGSLRMSGRLKPAPAPRRGSALPARAPAARSAAPAAAAARRGAPRSRAEVVRCRPFRNHYARARRPGHYPDVQSRWRGNHREAKCACPRHWRRGRVRRAPEWVRKAPGSVRSALAPRLDSRVDVTAASVEMGAPGPLPEPVASLVRVAVESDAPEQLVSAAQHALRKPLGLVGPAGEALDRALAVARAAATSRLVAPPGWWIVDVARATSPSFGYLAVGEQDGDDDPGGQLVELVSTLLADQLQRVALLRGRTSELLRRLVSDADVGPARARREAAGCGLALADAYWPAILGWRGPAPRPEVAEAIEREARAAVDGALSVVLSERTVLLHPRRDGGAGGGAAMDWFRRVSASAQRLAPTAQPQVIVSERELALGQLSVGVAELDALWALGPRAEDDQPLVSVRHYALDRFLARTAATTEASEFVRQQIGPLIDWDRQHRGDLLTVLEAGLDAPRHELAAARCFMHRNTFRNRFRHATRILGDNLGDPEVRLGVHVALKLRRILAPRQPRARDR